MRTFLWVLGVICCFCVSVNCSGPSVSCEDKVCSAEQACKDGQCVSSCAEGETICGGLCVDTKTDTNHCGACGTFCATSVSGASVFEASSSAVSQCVVTDSAGSVYVAGSFRDSATFGSHALKMTSGGTGMFVAKLDSSGKWAWAVEAGGFPGTIAGTHLSVDKSGNIYVSGYIGSGTVKFGSLSLEGGGQYDAFVAKIDSNGKWVWASHATGPDYIEALSQVVDDSGNVYVSGSFKQTATFGATTLTSAGDADVFIAKLDSRGKWAWAVGAGGSRLDRGHGLAVSSSGSLYVVGEFSDKATFGETTFTSAGMGDVFVAKLNNDGKWEWVTQGSGKSLNFGKDIIIGMTGELYVSGYYRTELTFGDIQLTNVGNESAFVAKINAKGKCEWAIQPDSESNSRANTMIRDNVGHVYLFGSFTKDISFGETKLNVERSAFYLVRISRTGKWVWATQANSAHMTKARDIAIDESLNVYVAARFSNPVRIGGEEWTSADNKKIVLVKLQQTTQSCSAGTCQ